MSGRGDRRIAQSTRAAGVLVVATTTLLAGVSLTPTIRSDAAVALVANVPPGPAPVTPTREVALPLNRAMPNAALRIYLAGLRKAGYEIPAPTRVSSTVSIGGRTYSMPGGGHEMQFPNVIPPEFIKVMPR